MPSPPAEQREPGERPPDRRREGDRRSRERREGLLLLPDVARPDSDRRWNPERRSVFERRGQETVGEHIRNALQLIAHVADSGELDDEHRRDLDAALFRLRFALDRLAQGAR